MSVAHTSVGAGLNYTDAPDMALALRQRGTLLICAAGVGEPKHRGNATLEKEPIANLRKYGDLLSV